MLYVLCTTKGGVADSTTGLCNELSLPEFHLSFLEPSERRPWDLGFGGLIYPHFFLCLRASCSSSKQVAWGYEGFASTIAFNSEGDTYIVLAGSTLPGSGISLSRAESISGFSARTKGCSILPSVAHAQL